MSAAPSEALEFAVVVPVRDGARHLGEALASVLAQDLAPREIVVVDDGSTDGSADVARAAGPTIRVVAQPPLGPGDARNRGVAETTAPWIAFLDADDRWTPTKSRLQADALRATPGAVACVGSVRQFFDADQGRTDPPVPEVLVGSTPGALLVRRDAFLATGGFATGSAVAEAAEWWIRFRASGAILATVDAIVLERRLHGHNRGRRPDARRDYLRLAREALARRRGGADAP